MTDAITPNLTPISEARSSQIAAIGYDSQSTLLYVQFRKGGLYIYDHVTPEEFAMLDGAVKVGSEFVKLIRGIKPFRRMDDVKTTAVEERAELAVTTTNILTMPQPEQKKVADDLATAAQEWAERAASTRITSVQTP